MDVLRLFFWNQLFMRSGCLGEGKESFNYAEIEGVAKTACKNVHDFYIDAMATYSIDIISH